MVVKVHKYADGGKIVKTADGVSRMYGPKRNVFQAVGDAVKAVGNFTGTKASKVPDRDGIAVKARTRRQQQLDDAGA